MSAFLMLFLLRAMLLGVLGLAALRLLRNRSASLQHAVAVGTVAAMIALPLFTYLLPARAVEVPRVPAALEFLTASPLSGSTIPTSPIAQTTAIDWPAIGAALWLAVAAVLLIRLGAGLLMVRRRVAQGKELRLGRAVPVLEDGGASIPMVIWMGRSRVMLPASWSFWPQEQLDHVLSHEEAHVRRGDWFSQMFMRLAAVAMWPNPTVHILARMSRSLAEQAADDIVLTSGADPAGYASSLLEIARGVAAVVKAPALAVPMAAKANVSRRIEMILNKNRQRKAISFGAVALITLAVAGVSGSVGCWALKPVDDARQGAPGSIRGVAFGATTPVMILNQKDVQTDLGLSADQVQTIKDTLKQFRDERRQLRNNKPAKAVSASLNDVTGRYLGQLEGVLTPAQKIRLNEIFIQWRHYDAVLEPEVQSAIGITASQKRTIGDLAARYQQGNKELAQRYRSGDLTPTTLQQSQQALNTNYEASLARVLTPAQTAKLKALGGNPFTGSIMGTIWSVGD